MLNTASAAFSHREGSMVTQVVFKFLVPFKVLYMLKPDAMTPTPDDDSLGHPRGGYAGPGHPSSW